MSDRIILAFKLEAKATNPDQGMVRPIAEIVNGELVQLDNFCHTNKVFITRNYQSIDKFEEKQLFRISVKVSEQQSFLVDPWDACKYVSEGIKAEKLKPNELIEIVAGELPEKNYRYFIAKSGVPLTQYIFIRDKDEQSFGPFSWEKKEDEQGILLGLLDDKPLLKSYKLSIGQIFKVTAENFEKCSFKCKAENRYFSFIENIQEFINGGHEFYDYASDEEIVKHCAKLANDIASKSLNKSDWDNFRKIANVIPKCSQGLHKARLARLSEIASESFLLQDDIRTNIEAFLKSGSGEKLVQDFIEQKKQQLLDSLRKSVLEEKNTEIEKVEEKLNQAELRIKEKTKEFNDLSNDVERKRKEANQEAILDTAVAERNEKLKHLEQLIVEKEGQLSVISEKLDDVSKLDEIKDEIRFQERLLDSVKEKQVGLELTTKKLQNEYNQAEDDLRGKLTNLKPYIEAVNGSFVLDKREKRDVSIQATPVNCTDVLEAQRAVVEAVRRNLRLKKRELETWQVANLLISTQQSFITFLAGLPGVGKTSLARLIAESQQLEPRLQEVSVARGWTSQKDLIGFYNPLSNRFQSSNSGLYPFIEAISNETKKDEQAMAYVLLDEANLSPIEHYWSTFMAMADGEGAQILRLGQDTLHVPECLRFLATINYDGTTEPLSPRVVDRAPVLVMESSLIYSGIDADIPEEGITLPLSSIEMNKLFGRVENPIFQDEEKEIFNELREILANPNLEEGRPISISQRKEIMIRQYCTQASSLMRSFGCEDFKALDLAILQHVLPQVRGNGQKFAKRLVRLKQTCDDEGLKGAANYLEKMLVYGETELHSYDFFCW